MKNKKERETNKSLKSKSGCGAGIQFALNPVSPRTNFKERDNAKHDRDNADVTGVQRGDRRMSVSGGCFTCYYYKLITGCLKI